MISRKPPRITIVAALALSAGCLASDLETGSIEAAVKSENALSMNALSMNALSMNALSMNALSMNGLALTATGLEQSSEGRHVLKYVIRCALPAGEVLTTTVAGTPYVFAGLLGLAPAWETLPLTLVESEKISACMLAHVNFFGVSVAISARHVSLPLDSIEMNRFDVFEGAFYGQLFAATPLMYACTGDAAPDFGVSYPNHATSDRLLRRCTDVNGATSMCGFAITGPCSTQCTNLGEGSFGSCFGGAGASGENFAEAVSIWLVEGSDPLSTWPAVYATYYGP